MGGKENRKLAREDKITQKPGEREKPSTKSI